MKERITSNVREDSLGKKTDYDDRTYVDWSHRKPKETWGFTKDFDYHLII